MSSSKLARLSKETTALFICDIQEKFNGLIWCYPSVITVAEKMIKASNILGMPVVVTEQYPKAFGNTVSKLDSVLKTAKENFTETKPNFAKTKFSMLIPEVEQILKENKVDSVILVGIESHVCVLQTALDLLENSYRVHVLADGVSSQNQCEIPIALNHMKAAGATINTSESALFQLLKDAKTENFKSISALIREYQQSSKECKLFKHAAGNAHL